MATVTFAYYRDEYGGSLIPEESFDRTAGDALRRIMMRTLWRASPDDSEAYSEELKKCTCEVAESVYRKDTASGENGMVLSSYSNDGESGTYDTSAVTERAVSECLEHSVIKWLGRFGLAYTGGGILA